MQRENPIHSVSAFSHPAYAKASFYAALEGYIETFSPTPRNMLGVNFSERSPQSWLEMAADFAAQIPGENKQTRQVIKDVEALVTQQKYPEARRIVRRGSQEADAEIRRIS